MSMRPETFTKIDLTPRRHHAWNVILFALGAILPPLAMAARFGIGKDFWINILLTVCGYIPGQIHNFYCQNIRDNKNHRRTPKWALRYGLVDRTAIDRRARRKQWASKYNERLPQSAFVGQELEEGQSSTPSQQPGDETQLRNRRDTTGGELWGETDERFYGQQRNNRDSASLNTASSSGGGGRWHYPYNFDQVDAVESPIVSKDKKKKKSGKKDRWARTEDAHAEVGTVDKKKKKKKSKSTPAESERWNDGRSDDSHNLIYNEPEDAVGGLYGDRSLPDPTLTNTEARKREEDEALNHQF